MKALKISIIVFIVVITLASNLHAQVASEFEESKGWKKVGPNLQQLWNAAVKSGNMTQKVECFIVANEIVDQGDQGFLLQQGFATQVATGTIARGHMKIQALPNLASMWLVRQIKLATKP